MSDVEDSAPPPGGPQLGREKPIHTEPAPTGRPCAPLTAVSGLRHAYPMRYDVDYPERLSRWKTFVRGILILPALLFLVIVGYMAIYALFAGWITVFFRRSYPRWLFAAGTGYLALVARVSAYGTLLTDRYPSFDATDTPVTLEFDHPPPGTLSRWRVAIWKGVLSVPHVIVLYFLGIALFVVVVLAWFAILFAGRYPRGMFAFVSGVQRWYFRVAGYLASFNDRFPPFSLSASAGPAERSSVVICGISGALLSAGFVALIAVAASVAGQPEVVEVDYAGLQRGVSADAGVRFRDVERDVEVRIVGADDPARALERIVGPAPGERVVAFEFDLWVDAGSATIQRDDGRLRVTLPSGEKRTYDAEIILVGNREAPRTVSAIDRESIVIGFVIPEGAEPEWLRFTPGFAGTGGIRYEFE
ncbi:MAG: hypothetical protein Kow0010_03750 [Dehalococcoidia bacterium]